MAASAILRAPSKLRTFFSSSGAFFSDFAALFSSDCAGVL